MSQQKSQQAYAPIKVDAVAIDNDEDSVPITAEAHPVKDSQRRILQVTASTKMYGDYELSVDTEDGATALVRVPNKGVNAGEVFFADVIREDMSDKAPVGAWRNAFCDCFSLGCCHPTFCCALWCPFLALGQIMTRLKLTWYASPEQSSSRHGSDTGTSTFCIMVSIFVFMQVTHYLLAFIAFELTPRNPYSIQYPNNGNYYDQPQTEPTIAVVIRGLDNLMVMTFLIYFLFIGVRTRAYIRRKYAIPEECVPGCEDCCALYWCGCPTIIQMSRHITNFDTAKAGCCNSTGVEVKAYAVESTIV